MDKPETLVETTTKNNITTQKTKNMRNTDPIIKHTKKKKLVVNPSVLER